MYNVATRGPFKGLNPRVAPVAVAGVLSITGLAVYRPAVIERLVVGSRDQLTPLLEWYYVALMAYFLAMVIWLGTGRYKNIRLGRDDEVPEFTTLSWLAMLFAAGMGVGLLFWAVAEPLSHYRGNPFLSGADSSAAADLSMVLTYFHWGLSAWGVFALLALILAYFGYRKGQPLALRSALHPLLGKHTHGWAGDLVDLLAILATVFGIVTTLGLGIKQLETGLGLMLGFDYGGAGMELFLTGLLTLVAIISVITGVHVGIQRVSQANLWLSLALLLLLLIWGPTHYLLALVVQSTGGYLQNLMSLSFYTHANQPGDWHQVWTVFYWGWWLAWAPFVGLFIARISRGRTLREFVMGVLLVPTLITFVWLGLLGGTALHAETSGLAAIADIVAEDITRATFATLATLEPAGIARAGGILITILIATYLVTSANAGIVVINTLLAHGAIEHRRGHLILWGLAIGLVTAVLLLAGGLEVLQGAVIMAALPFSLVMLVMVAGLLRGLKDDRYAPRPGEYRILPVEPWQVPDRLPEDYEVDDDAPLAEESDAMEAAGQGNPHKP
ncbi:choline transporter [Thiohalobacter sp. COW1]|uniref:BCCT family transporter n=1 Tax=Thiohalobacter sp. COW1 TaxID=2795687 RepID=UPI001915D42C|nr:BCCT family transporter [Thiohalobacter sp. COW1]BCO32889.1 choline transporter [Thiohalobacter sp. COW1]